MAVTLAQFKIEFPEFTEIADAVIQPRLDEWDAMLSGFAGLHDRAVYRRTALALSRTEWGMPTEPTNDQPTTYEREWNAILHMSYRRGTVSGGGLT